MPPAVDASLLARARIERPGSSGASRSRSRNIADIRTPPTPSVIGVVHLGQQGGPAAFEALDDRELPQRARRIEGVLVG